MAGHHSTLRWVKQDDDLCRLLVDHGASTTHIDCDGNTLLHIAAKLGSVWVARRLLNSRAGLQDVWNSRQETALHVAVKYGQRSVVHLLLLAGVNAERADADGYTPMQKAVQGGQYAIAKDLIKHNVKVDRIALQRVAIPLGTDSSSHYKYEMIMRLLLSKDPGIVLASYSAKPPTYADNADSAKERMAVKQDKMGSKPLPRLPVPSPPSEPLTPLSPTGSRSNSLVPTTSRPSVSSVGSSMLAASLKSPEPATETIDPFEVSIPKAEVVTPVQVINNEANLNLSTALKVNTGAQIVGAGANIANTILNFV